MKIKAYLVIIIITATVLSACTKNNTNDSDSTGNNDNTDGVSSASIVDTEEAFKKAISSSGSWIICLTKDLSVDSDLVLEGEFKNGKKDEAGNDVIQRKIALYSQDESRNITARYVLTAPKMTIESPMASIQHGTFKGDLYIDVDNFALVDTTVEGNMYFTKQEYINTFSMDETSKVTGTVSVVQ